MALFWRRWRGPAADAPCRAKVKPQKVERVKHWLPFPAEQLIELAQALRVDPNNLAIKDGVLDGQLGERPLECLKSKVPLIARNQLRLAVLQIRDRPEAVVFQLENVIGMVEGLPHQTEPHGVNAREHNCLSLRLGMPEPPLRSRLEKSGPALRPHQFIRIGVDREKIAVGHVRICRPWHHLKKVSIERKG